MTTEFASFTLWFGVYFILSLWFVIPQTGEEKIHFLQVETTTNFILDGFLQLIKAYSIMTASMKKAASYAYTLSTPTDFAETETRDRTAIPKKQTTTANPDAAFLSPHHPDATPLSLDNALSELSLGTIAATDITKLYSAHAAHPPSDPFSSVDKSDHDSALDHSETKPRKPKLRRDYSVSQPTLADGSKQIVFQVQQMAPAPCKCWDYIQL
jgi:hypothetical protein